MHTNNPEKRDKYISLYANITTLNRWEITAEQSEMTSYYGHCTRTVITYWTLDSLGTRPDFFKTLALYKSRIYLLTYLLTYYMIILLLSCCINF